MAGRRSCDRTPPIPSPIVVVIETAEDDALDTAVDVVTLESTMLIFDRGDIIFNRSPKRISRDLYNAGLY